MNKVTQKGNASMAETGTAGTPQGIFVLGMHRSGTSAFARVLNMLGCALSDNLLGAGEGNETGHWEAIEAVTLNDEMLASAGSNHDDWGPINDDWRNSAIRSQMVHSASFVLADHAKLGPLFAIKDPRMCRLADVWLEGASEAGVEPLVCLMIRNPAEVAASLETRDLMATGYSELLWLRHVLDAEHFTREQKRVICRYDELMGNWQGLVAKIKGGLGISFPRNSLKVHAEISQFVTPSQRHHLADSSAVIASQAYSHWLRTTFQIMVAWSEDGENASDYRALDEVREEIDRAYGACARMLMTRDVAGAAGSGAQLRGELANLRDEVEHNAQALRQAEQEAAELRIAAAQREAELAEQLRAATTQAQAMQSEIDGLDAALASHMNTSKEAASLRIEIAERAAELAALQSALGSTQAEAATERQLRTETEARLCEASHGLQEQQARNAKLAGQVETANGALIQRQEELTERIAELAALQSALGSTQAEAATERQLRSETEAQLSETSQELHEHQLRNAELAGQVSTLQSTLTQRQEELAQLISQFHEAEKARLRAEMDCERERERSLEQEKRIASAGVEIGSLQALLDEERRSAAQRSDASTSDLAELAILLKEREDAYRRALEQNKGSTAEAHRLAEELLKLRHLANEAEAASMAAEQKLLARSNELAKLTAIVELEAGRADASEHETRWLRDVRRLEDGFPHWWAIMPRAWRQRWAHRRYRQAALFDAEAYLAHYPDVGEGGMDPIRHYILHGMAEGRIRPHLL